MRRHYPLDSARPSKCDPPGRGHTARVSVGGRASSRVIHARFQDSASWLTPSGVAKKRRMIESKGMPDVAGWRFITLTLNHDFFGDCPLTAYLEGKEKLRRFIEAGKVAGLWARDVSWCWKLEFQRNGWAHWHFLLNRKRKFTENEMAKIREIWGLGRTNVKRITKGKFGYQFKYAFKGVFQDDDEHGQHLCVPQWFLEHYVPAVPESFPGAEDAEKPRSFARVRFWQTSKGFYTGHRIERPEPEEPLSSILPLPVSEVLEARKQALVVVARDGSGRYLQSRRFKLGVSSDRFFRAHLWDAENGAGATLSVRSFALDPQTLAKLIESHQLWTLKPLLRKNRLTLNRALFLRQTFQALEVY